MRYGHTASAIGDKVYIFGGRNDKNGACNNLFCFDTSKFTLYTYDRHVISFDQHTVWWCG